MKWVLVVLACGTSAVAVLVGFMYWDAAENRGWEVGYYHDYNRMRHLLLEIPGVVIVKERHTHDVVLEEFEFALTVHGRPVRLYFSESDSVRTISRDAARKNLRAWIADELGAAHPDTSTTSSIVGERPSWPERPKRPNEAPR